MNTSASNDGFLEEFCQQLATQEGSIPHMYCDSRGYVTVGVGHMLATAEDAAKLPFLHRDTGQPASRQEIIDDYNRVKSAYSSGSNWGATHYSTVARLNLSKESVEQLLYDNVAQFEKSLVLDLPDFLHYPKPAQQALLDMAFNLGVKKLINGYPTLMHAVKSQDWAVCAQECHRRGISDARNTETAERFTEASSATTKQT